jgi:hypothetical protein
MLDLVNYLRSTRGIRDRCGHLFQLAEADQLPYFRLDLSQLDRVAEAVIAVIQQTYPDLNIPFHSRWRHFAAGGVPRLQWLDQELGQASSLEQLRSQFDLAITSVLLDAGAGATWRYTETETGQTFSRSEGLAVASFHLFCQGGFSGDPAFPWQADAQGLQAIAADEFEQGFQVSETNPLVGVEGRLALMQHLGHVLTQHPDLFGQNPSRPGHLADYVLGQAQDGVLEADRVLAAVLEGLSEIWPGRVTLDQVNLGDVWPHTALPDQGPGSQLVPFHKLSQWLTYSLLEPLQSFGLVIANLDSLTGLPEYRNGGLCLDLGLLQPKDAAILSQPHLPSSEVIVEWRALTVILLDHIAATIRQKLGLSATELPLAKVLEGGTWATGRQIAAQLRPKGIPPLQIVSDGTIF